jgi:hypothetical protein
VTQIRIGDLRLQPAAFWAEKLPIAVQVKFATLNGELKTREGLVQFKIGDAILTGVEGECWPIEREKFFQSYEAKPPTMVGLGGQYVKRPMRVLCLKVDRILEISLPGKRGTLKAAPGDYLVQYNIGDLAVVGESIFRNSYQVIT